jgi:hypothetical protein
VAGAHERLASHPKPNDTLDDAAGSSAGPTLSTALAIYNAFASGLFTPHRTPGCHSGQTVSGVGLTKFATRVGEMVDHGWEAAIGSFVTCGQVIGWLEGFKAITDIFCVVEGNFCGINVVLKEKSRS